MLEQAKRGAHSTNGGSDRARGDKPAVRDWWGVTWHHTFLAHSAVRVVCVWLCVAVWLWLCGCVWLCGYGCVPAPSPI